MHASGAAIVGLVRIIMVAARLVGARMPVPLVNGGTVPYLNLDYAASAPALFEVQAAVDALLPWYSSVHRGAGLKSQVSTAAYEGARREVAEFFGARQDDAVIFTRNTTDSMNLLAASLPAGTRVFTFDTEHHANLLPWRRGTLTCLPTPSSAAEALEALDRALEDDAAGPEALVSVTGASNVTGEIWPVAEIGGVAHRRGARLLVDAAQLAPHVPLDMTAIGADFLAASGHKLYAPFGAGILIGRSDWLGRGTPFLAGGGAVVLVTRTGQIWSDLPDRQEAGSPNVVGAVAMGVACRTLSAIGMGEIAHHDADLLAYGRGRLRKVPGLELYSLWGPGHPTIGVLTFNLAGYEHNLLAAVLSAEHGIGVRHGCFCAHMLVSRLLRIDEASSERMSQRIRAGERVPLPGAVRASFGVDSTREDVDRLAEALGRIAADGPDWGYVLDPESGEYSPDPDRRVWPDLPFPLPRTVAAGAGESS